MEIPRRTLYRKESDRGGEKKGGKMVCNFCKKKGSGLAEDWEIILPREYGSIGYKGKAKRLHLCPECSYEALTFRVKEGDHFYFETDGVRKSTEPPSLECEPETGSLRNIRLAVKKHQMGECRCKKGVNLHEDTLISLLREKVSSKMETLVNISLVCNEMIRINEGAIKTLKEKKEEAKKAHEIAKSEFASYMKKIGRW